MKRLLTLEDLPEAITGATTFVRVDFNAPISNGRVIDDTRLLGALPTIAELRRRGARLLLASHRGRPKGEPDPALSLRPVAERLSELLEAPVGFAEDCVGPAATAAREALEPGDVCLLENLRFHPGEKANDPDFANALGLGPKMRLDVVLEGPEDGAEAEPVDRGRQSKEDTDPDLRQSVQPILHRSLGCCGLPPQS